MTVDLALRPADEGTPPPGTLALSLEVLAEVSTGHEALTGLLAPALRPA